MQIMYQRLKDSSYKGFSVGQGATDIKSVIISHSLRTMPVPNLVPKIR